MINKKNIFLLIILLPLFAFAQQQVKIMSYNIRLDVKSDGENRWDARKYQVANLMSYHEADFMGLQEVQHHQLQFLQENLPQYAYIGVGRDDGKEGGEYSCIFYDKEKFTVVEQGTFWLSPTPETPSKGWDAAYPRVCTWGLFKMKKSKQMFYVVNTHLDHVGKLARKNSVNLIMERVAKINVKNTLVFFTGDFNSLPTDEPITDVTKTYANTRAISKQVYGAPDTWNGFKFTEKLDGCIDYIFANDPSKIEVEKFATLTDSYDLKYPSDHLPVMATIRFKK